LLVAGWYFGLEVLLKFVELQLAVCDNVCKECSNGITQNL